MNLSKVTKKLARAEDWADLIFAQHAKSVESILETGRLLLKAKSDLVHGEWGRLFEDHLLPFGIDAAQRFMTIASHPLLSNTEHVRSLPASWGTLYQLTRVPEPMLKQALHDGVITSDMPRKAVAGLLPQPAVKTPDVHSALDAISRRLDKLWDQHPKQRPHIEAAISAWAAYFANRREDRDEH